MRSFTSLWLCSLQLAVFSACGPAGSVAPTAPTAVVNPTPPPPTAAPGSIRFAAVTHASGAALKVQDCGPSFTGIAGNHLCNEEWHAAFDITSGVDLSNGVVTVSFENDGRRCGEVQTANQAFAAGRERLVGTSGPVYVTHEREGYDNLTVEQACDFPVTTSRLVVQLWDPRKPATPLARQEFDYTFTFVAP